MSGPVRFWCNNDKRPQDRRWWGPTLWMSFINTALLDGGCPEHPRHGSFVNNIVNMIHCEHIALWQLGLGWSWGHQYWFCVLVESEFIARLHPRYLAPGLTPR